MSLDQIYETKSNYLKVEDLSGQKVHVTIKDANIETLGDDKKIVLDFVEGSGKRLALNITNARMCAMLFDTEDHKSWIGGRITLKPDITSFKGSPTKCIRVDSELPTQPSGWQPKTVVPQREQATDPNQVPF
jgi:hypothetical protein